MNQVSTKTIAFSLLLLIYPVLAQPQGFSDNRYDIEICEKGLLIAFSEIDANKVDWGLVNKSHQLLTSKDRKSILFIWSSMLDYFAQLEYIKQLNKNFSDVRSKSVKQNEFVNYYLAFLIQYRFALTILDVLDQNESLDTILNESNEDLGINEGTYLQFKSHFLNLAIASEFFALNAIYEQLVQKNLDQEMRHKLEIESMHIFKYGLSKGVAMTISNAFDVIHQRSFKLWLPVQKNVSTWMGDTKVWRRGEALITEKQIKQMTTQMLPGDIMLQRREWYLTNVGLPGYWTHSALYIGTAEERNALFNSDPETVSWLSEMGISSDSFDDLLKQKYPRVYPLMLRNTESNDSIRVIEAVSEGVIFTTMNASAHCDGIVVLRPMISAKEKAMAIYRALSFFGRPYDFNFDFTTDSSFVCTELLYKSYEPSDDMKGITFKTVHIGDRIVTPGNLIAKQFSDEWESEGQQLEFILFLDGFERKKKAIKSTVETFITSWKRPDWYFVVQKY